jgi:hypothetical protein
MHFNHMAIRDGGVVHGQGSDAVGAFTIQGQQNGTSVNFTKQYHGAHTVQYNGQLQGNVVNGTWSLQGMTGSFQLSMETQQWNGYFEQNGQRTPMKLDLNVDENGVFGLGSDPNGTFQVRGALNNANNTMMFNKVYNGAHTVQYYGQVTKSPQNW